MQPRRLLALTLMISGSLFASTAFAQTEEDPEPEVSDVGPYERMLSIGATGGYLTPFGLIGGVIEFAPIEWFVVYAGGGVSLSGGRVAGGVNFRAPVDSTAFGIQFGLAGGPHDDYGRGEENTRLHRYWEFALFAHMALNVEYRWDEGIFGRLALGAERLIAGDVTACADGDEVCVPGRTDLIQPIEPFVSLTIGYAFEL